MPSSADQQLISEFVLAFSKLNDCLAHQRDPDPVHSALAIDDPDEHGFWYWKPIPMETGRSCLESIYAKLPGRFPRLYEELVLSYRWAEVDLKTFTLLANPPSEGLGLLLEQIHRDKHLTKVLEANGYMRFAKGPDIDYDPVCFDLRRCRQGGDCPIVKLDHEEILCNSRIREVAELAPSFRNLMMKTIEDARTPGTP